MAGKSNRSDSQCSVRVSVVPFLLGGKAQPIKRDTSGERLFNHAKRQSAWLH